MFANPCAWQWPARPAAGALLLLGGLLLNVCAVRAQGAAPVEPGVVTPVLAPSPALGTASPATPPAGPVPAVQPLPAVQPPPPEASPYGLRALWRQGDGVARATLLVLLLMSLASWAVLIGRVLSWPRLRRDAQQVSAFWQHGDPQAALASLRPASLQRHVAVAALAAVSAETQPSGWLRGVDREAWLAQTIEQALTQASHRLNEGLTLLATVGATAPFVGLFGTVWAIYQALIRIGATGQASLDRVAGPVGEALVMTAFGLAVAVPAVIAYNLLARRNKLLLDELRAFGSALHTALSAGHRPAPR